MCYFAQLFSRVWACFLVSKSLILSSLGLNLCLRFSFVLKSVFLLFSKIFKFYYYFLTYNLLSPILIDFGWHRYWIFCYCFRKFLSPYFSLLFLYFLFLFCFYFFLLVFLFIGDFPSGSCSEWMDFMNIYYFCLLLSQLCWPIQWVTYPLLVYFHVCNFHLVLFYNFKYFAEILLFY